MPPGCERGLQSEKFVPPSFTATTSRNIARHQERGDEKHSEDDKVTCATVAAICPVARKGRTSPWD